MTAFGVPQSHLARNGRRGFSPTVKGAPSIHHNRILNTVIRDGGQPTVGVSGKGLDVAVSADSALLFQAKKTSSYDVEGYRQHHVWSSPDFRSCRADSLPHRFRLPVAGRVVRPGAPGRRAGTRLSNDWFLLLGLILSDGHISKSKSVVSLHQSTSKPLVVTEIDAVLTRLEIAYNRYMDNRKDTPMSVDGPEYTRNGDMITWQINGADAARIRDVILRGQRRRYSAAKHYRKRSHLSWERGEIVRVDGWKEPERRIPLWVLERASRTEILCLIRGLMLGDGNLAYITESRDSGVYYTKEADDAGRFQALCALVGYRSSVTRRPDGQHCIAFTHRGDVELIRDSSVKSGASAPVWSAVTEHGSLLVRRNGRTFIA